MTIQAFGLYILLPIFLMFVIWDIAERFNRIAATVPPKKWLNVVCGLVWVMKMLVATVLLFWLLIVAVAFIV